MGKHSHKSEWFIPPNASKGGKKDIRNSRILHFVNRSHLISTFLLIAGLCQVFMGLFVVTVSVLGLIEPLWLSTAMSMAASITTMIGLYLVYITLSKSNSRNMLLRNAMRRVMEAKN